MKFLPAGAALCLLAYAQDFDVLIRNGRIVDGTGDASFVGDVAIQGGKIAAIGFLPKTKAKRVIEAKGLVVAPGFIDIHNHSDYSLLVDGTAQSMVRQGVTSMILGEGGSAAPSHADFADFNTYFARLLKQGISTNIGTYIGSSQVWTYVHGERAGPVTPDELQRMQDLVRQAMQEGALGVASSLSGPPGAWIDTATLVAMCKVAGEYGGLYSTHLRTEGKGVFEAAAEAMEIGRRAGVPVDIIHLKIADHTLWGRMPELVASIAQARANGQDVTANVYPYRAGQNNLASIIPPWAHDGGKEAMLGRLKDPALHDRLVNEIEHGIPGSDWYDHYTATGSWEGMLLVSLSNPSYKKFEGQRMNEVIAAIGGKPIDALFKILEDNNGSVPTIYFHHDENDMRYALKQPFVSIGSDGTAVAITGPTAEGHPHPRYFGTFPRVLGRYVRDEKVLTLEDAIRKMTSANAIKIHVYDRGLLRPGMWADVTVFDPATIIDNATWEQPHQYATGVRYLLVNGKLVIDGGEHTGARPGTILYGPGRHSDRDAAEWVIRSGGNVRIAGDDEIIRDAADLPTGDITVLSVDLVGTTIDPKDLKRLSGLTELRELLLPAPSFNPGAGSKLDANDALAALGSLHHLEKLWFSLHFLTEIHVEDKGLAHLKDLTQLRELRLVQTKVRGPGLAPFVNLRALDLGETPFRDDGTQYLRGMSHLQRLSLRDTLVTDAGLKNLAGLKELESLDLYGLKITDAGLRSLGGLKNLHSLNLLGGTLTDDSASVLAGFSDLEDLNLYRTQISNAGLDKLKGLKHLTALDLRYTGVSSSGVEALHAALPKCRVEFEDAIVRPAGDVALGNSTPRGAGESAITAWVKQLGGRVVVRADRIREIDLARTPVSDAQLHALATLESLEKLSLSTTQVGDVGAQLLAKLTSLRDMDLSNTMVTDKAIAQFGNLKSLTRLALNNSQVHGSGFAALAGLSVGVVELSGAPVNDEGLRSVSALKSLRELRLSSTDITDEGLAAFSAMTSLTSLDLSSTDIGDAGLAQLKRLTGLTRLNLAYSRVTNKGLQALAGMTALEELELARTRVSDPGVDAIQKLTALKRLNLDYTTVSDKSLQLLRQSLPKLVELRLDSANISDAGLQTLRGMAGLRVLNLYHTLVTEKGYEDLKKNLPDCRIIFDRDSSLPNRRHS
jgi:dihydroorotase/N-acyl-D-amino-acid deacylase